jgi:hypothetical protein
MIYVDDVQKSPEEFCALFGMDYKKIMKFGIFEINPKKKKVDRLNGGFRYPAGHNILSSFWGKDTSGKSVKIQYALSVSPEAVGAQVLTKYEPRKFMFPGEEFIMVLEADKAVYMFIHPTCLDSPFYKAGRPFDYFLQDKEKEARLRVESKSKLFEAMSKIQGPEKMSVDEMRVLAKGLGEPGIDAMDDYQVQDVLIARCEKNPAQFLTDTNSKNTTFYGVIRNLIDKGTIQFKNVNGIDRWYWGAGPLDGEEIVIIEKNRDSFETLKTYIVDNAARFYALVMQLNTDVNTDSKLDKFLKEQEEKDSLKYHREDEVWKRGSESPVTNFIPPVPQPSVEEEQIPTPPEPVDLGPLPTNFNETIDYMTRRDGKRPTNVDAAAFLRSINPV